MMKKVGLTRHAQNRMRQRGVTNNTLEAVLIHSDKKRYRGDGKWGLFVSKKKIRGMGPRTPEGVDTDRLKNIVVLVSKDSLITVLKSERCYLHRSAA